MTSHAEPATVPPSTRSMLGGIVIGVLAGFLSGLFGVGGGTVIVPGLVMAVRMNQRLAHGTSLAAIIPISLAGMGGFALEGKVDWAVAGLLVAGSLAGARLGTLLLHRVSQHHLRLAFAAILILAAVELIVELPDSFARDPLTATMGAGLVAVGFIGGAVAGMLGVGGGVIMVPAQMLLFGIPGAVAKGTSLAVIVPTALIATAENRRRGNADVPLAMVIGVAGVVSAFVASKIAVDLDAITSNLLFALLLSLVSFRLLLQRRSAAE